MVKFLSRIPDCGSQSLLDLFLFSDPNIFSIVAFLPVANSDHAVVSVSIDFCSNSIWEDIFRLGAPAVAAEFVSGSRLESMDISLIVNITFSLTHIYGFQLFLLLS